MDSISFADGMKILELARQNMSAPAPAAAKPLPAYGPHNSVLNPEQAATLHLLWSILGIDGSTVGRGSTVTIGANHVDRQDGGPAGAGDAPAVAPLGNPDPGADSRPEAQGPLNGSGQEAGAAQVDGQV